MISPFFLPGSIINMFSGLASIHYVFKGPDLGTVSACSTAHHSIGEAARLIEYGDADNMPAELAVVLLDALVQLQLDNPRFREWKEYSARALVKGTLQSRAASIIIDPSAGYSLRALLLEQLRRLPSPDLIPELRQLASGSEGAVSLMRTRLHPVRL